MESTKGIAFAITEYPHKLLCIQCNTASTISIVICFTIYYVYTVEEIDKGEAGYTYDPNVYKLTIKVDSAEEGMRLDVFITDDSGERSEMVFTNTYEKGKTPDQPGKPGKSTRTGDDSSVLLWTALAAIALSAIGVLVFWRRKDRQQ